MGWGPHERISAFLQVVSCDSPRLSYLEYCRYKASPPPRLGSLSRTCFSTFNYEFSTKAFIRCHCPTFVLPASKPRNPNTPLFFKKLHQPACLISFDLEMHRKVLSSIHLCLQCALSSVSLGPRRPQGIFRKRLSEMGKNQTELFYTYGRRDLNWFCGHNSA